MECPFCGYVVNRVSVGKGLTAAGSKEDAAAFKGDRFTCPKCGKESKTQSTDRRNEGRGIETRIVPLPREKK